MISDMIIAGVNLVIYGNSRTYPRTEPSSTLDFSQKYGKRIEEARESLSKAYLCTQATECYERKS